MRTERNARGSSHSEMRTEACYRPTAPTGGFPALTPPNPSSPTLQTHRHIASEPRTSAADEELRDGPIVIEKSTAAIFKKDFANISRNLIIISGN